jgi:hypothetical protein
MGTPALPGISKVERHAVLSSDGRYRYTLYRLWDDSLPEVTWVMLNPSTADAEQDDPTIRKCVGFAQRWGCGSIRVVNLFAYRATNPRELTLADDPVGPINVPTLAVATNGFCVAGWGAAKTPPKPLDVIAHKPLWCLGVTKSGDPRHPLYVSYETPLQVWVR